MGVDVHRILGESVLEELAEKPSTFARRAVQQVYLVPYLRERSSEELQELCRRYAIPFAVVRTTEEISRCPQLKVRDFFVQISRAQVGTLTYPGAPWKFSKTPWRILRPAPLLGEHNHLVWGRLGLSPDEITALSRNGII